MHQKGRYFVNVEVNQNRGIDIIYYAIYSIMYREVFYGCTVKIKDVSDLIEISESTLYPILRRLEMGGKVKSYTTQYNNRLRKYFHLTEEGRQYLKNFDKDRAQLLKILDYIAEEDEK